MFEHLLILRNNLSYSPAVRLSLEIFQEQILETKHCLLCVDCGRAHSGSSRMISSLTLGFSGTEIVPSHMCGLSMWHEMADYPCRGSLPLPENHSQERARQPKHHVQLTLAQPWITVLFQISCVFIANKSIIFNLYYSLKS